MSWRNYYYRRRNYYYRKTYKEKFFFSEKEIDFTTEYLDYNQFLLQEFFNADLETKNKISNYYYNEYGKQSFGYLKRKYSEWANGYYHLTDLMKERIVSFMPQFLTEEAKYKLGIHDFMSSIKKTVNDFWKKETYNYRGRYWHSQSSNKERLSSINDVLELFENDYEKINELTFNQFRFNVLTDEEKEEALEVSKYILKVKLQNTFNQVKKDFDIFLPIIAKFKRGAFTASYELSFYECHLDLSNKDYQELSFPNFRINEIETNSNYRKYSDKYLAYEMVSVNFESKKAISKSFLNNHDMNLFYAHYEELAKGDSAVDMNGTFQGEGGKLIIKAEMKPLNILKVSLSKSIFKLSVVLIVIAGIISWSIREEWYSFLFLGGLIGAFISFGFIKEEISELKILIKEFKQYGK